MVVYCAMHGKSQQEYSVVLNRVKFLADLQVFQAKIVSTDQEIGLINAVKAMYPLTTLFKTCSFHWIDNVRKSLISGGLKKTVKKIYKREVKKKY